MARNKGIPSQESVPHQVRFPHEIDSNYEAMSTSRPTGNASSGFPGDFPIPTPRTKMEMYLADGAFNFPSHTNGKKE
jgi:hypothetical protein